MSEQFWFDWLCRVYVQRADARQRDMGLQYTEAETHDLARGIAAACVSERERIRKLALEPSEEALDRAAAAVEAAMEGEDSPEDIARAVLRAFAEEIGE